MKKSNFKDMLTGILDDMAQHELISYEIKKDGEIRLKISDDTDALEHFTSLVEKFEDNQDAEPDLSSEYIQSMLDEFDDEEDVYRKKEKRQKNYRRLIKKIAKKQAKILRKEEKLAEYIESKLD